MEDPGRLPGRTGCRPRPARGLRRLRVRLRLDHLRHRRLGCGVRRAAGASPEVAGARVVSRNRRYLALSVVVIVATVAGMLLLLPSGASVALDVRRSALRTSPDGVAGWARSLEELQRPAVMRFDSYARTTPTGEAQVLLEPLVEPTDAEISSLL